MSRRPRHYLLPDEPTVNPDFGQPMTWETIRHLAHDSGRGILVCSHDPNHVLSSPRWGSTLW